MPSERCSIEEQSKEYCGCGVLCLVTWCTPRTTSLDITRHIHNILSTAPQLSISQKALVCLVTWCTLCTMSLDTTHHIHNILSTVPQLSISQKALGTLPEDGNVM